MKFLRLKSVAEYHSQLLDKFNRSRHSQSVDELRRSRLLIGILMYAFLLTSVMSSVRLASEGLSDSTRVALFVPGIMASLLSLIYMTQQIKIIADVTIVIILGLILTMAYFDGGLTSRVLTWLPALPLLANFVAHNLRAIPTLLLTCIGLASLYYADSHGFIPIKDTADPLLGRMLAGVMSVLFVTLVSLGYEQSRREAEADMIAAKKMAEDLTQLKSEFLANMSHDLRTPMNGVLGMLNLLMREDLSESQRHRTRLAHSSAASLLSLLNDILDFSKFEAGKVDLELIDFDPCKLLGEISESLALIAQEKDLELILDFSEVNHFQLRGDAGKVRQLFTNLIGNAIKFTSEGEIIIKISTRSEENSPGKIGFYGQVIDSGVGIPDTAKDQLFSAFTQADSSITRRFGGTGLGLAICKKLCEAMDGSIEVDSTLGQGSRFSFNVLLEESDSAGTFRSTELSHSVENKKLLIAEDNEKNSAVLAKQCEQWGIHVDTAQTPEKVWKILKSNQSTPIDIIFINMQFGDTDGIAFGREILNKLDQDAPQLILMTPIAVQLTSKELIDQGFCGHFPKPATLSDLLTSLNKAVTTEKLSVVSPEKLAPTADSHPAPSPAIGSVLIVEDNPINQEVALGLLEDSGLRADTADNGKEAIELLQQSENTTYDLILMDCQMPVMDGFETSKQIRAGVAGERHRQTPIIALTANAMKGDKDRCLAVGMNDYLTKPLEPEALDKALEHWCKVNKSDRHSEVKQDNTNDTNDLWDYQAALKRFRGKEQLLLNLSKRYIESAPQLWRAANDDFKAKDFKSMADHLHGLKGTTGNLGCTKLYTGLAALESKLSEVEHSDFLVQLNELGTVLENTLDHLRTYSSDTKGSQPTPNNSEAS